MFSILLYISINLELKNSKNVTSMLLVKVTLTLVLISVSHCSQDFLAPVTRHLMLVYYTVSWRYYLLFLAMEDQ